MGGRGDESGVVRVVRERTGDEEGGQEAVEHERLLLVHPQAPVHGLHANVVRSLQHYTTNMLLSFM